MNNRPRRALRNRRGAQPGEMRSTNQTHLPADHSRWRPLLPYLETHLTMHAMDRRGRGPVATRGTTRWSGSTRDVAAVVDAVAAASGRHVDEYGHSRGRSSHSAPQRSRRTCAGWCSTTGGPSLIRRSTPSRRKPWERMNQLLAQGDPGGVVETASSARLARAVAATITAPVLLVTGQDSTDPAKAEVDAVAEALPDAVAHHRRGPEPRPTWTPERSRQRCRASSARVVPLSHQTDRVPRRHAVEDGEAGERGAGAPQPPPAGGRGGTRRTTA